MKKILYSVFYRVLFGSEFLKLPVSVRLFVCREEKKKEKREGGRENLMSAHAHTPLRARATKSSALLACVSSQSGRDGCGVRIEYNLTSGEGSITRVLQFSLHLLSPRSRRYLFMLCVSSVQNGPRHLSIEYEDFE